MGAPDNVPFKMVLDLVEHWEWTPEGLCFGKLGTEGYGLYTSYKDNPHHGIMFVCPGCRSITAIQFYQLDGRAMWTWDGNVESPTCTPSILHTKRGDGSKSDGCGWHGYLTNGEFRSC